MANNFRWGCNLKLTFSKKILVLFAGLVSFSVLFNADSDSVSGVSDIVKTNNIHSTTESLEASKQEPVLSHMLERHHEVLLQGDEISILRERVIKLGGIVTHELPLINGIGVRVNDTQLELLKTLSKLNSVTENQAVFTSGSLQNCLVYGSHVAELTDDSIRWNLYNARDIQAVVDNMSFKWPKELGSSFAITVDGIPYYSGVINADSEHLSVDITDSAKLEPYESITVKVSFEDSDIENYQQSDFSIDVHFKQTCNISLVKGYNTQANEGDSNSYYVNKIGANELHEKGITGRNVTIAVVDSGLWAAHSALSQDTVNNTRIVMAHISLVLLLTAPLLLLMDKRAVIIRESPLMPI
jgi:serine protease AprX